jgi:Protein of unknown function DUF86
MTPSGFATCWMPCAKRRDSPRRVPGVTWITTGCWCSRSSKDVEIIGEAASRVSAGTRLEWADIPWQDIVAMRHRLIHGYFDIDLDIVWSTVTDDLPPLAAQLERALSSASR